MTSQWIQVPCPVCLVPQPAPIRLEMGEVDYVQNSVPVQMKADLTQVNQHVATCKRRREQ